MRTKIKKVQSFALGDEVQQRRANYEGVRRRGIVVEIDARKLRARVSWMGLGKNLRTWVGYKYLRMAEPTPYDYKPEL